MLTLTKLIDTYDLSLNPSGLSKCLEKRGVIIDVEYESTTGRGHTKTFKAIADEFLHLGENKASGFHEFKTEMKFKEEAIPEILDLVIEQLEKDRGTLK